MNLLRVLCFICCLSACSYVLFAQDDVYEDYSDAQPAFADDSASAEYDGLDQVPPEPPQSEIIEDGFVDPEPPPEPEAYDSYYEEEPPEVIPPPSESYEVETRPFDSQTPEVNEVYGHENSQDMRAVESRERPIEKYDDAKQVEETEQAVSESSLDIAEDKVRGLESNLKNQVDPVSASGNSPFGGEEYADAFKELEDELGEDMMDEKSYSNLLKLAIAPYKGKSESEIKKMLLEQFQEGWMAKVLQWSGPKLINFVAATIADPVALPRMGKIIDERNKFYRYIWVNLGVFLMSYILRKVFLKNKTFWQKIRIHFFLFNIMNIFRVAIFLFFFNFEMERVFEIAKDIFFG